MRHPTNHLVLALFAALAALAPLDRALAQDTDVIEVAKVTTDDAPVVLVIGQRAGCVNDQILRGSGSLLVDNFLPPGVSCVPQIAVFARDRAVLLYQTPPGTWTSAAGDDVSLPGLDPAVVVNVATWIVHGPYQPTKDRAVMDLDRANQLYWRCGVRFQSTPVSNDDLTDPAHANFRAIDCGSPVLSDSTLLGLGASAQQINVFYVDHVVSGDVFDRGAQCGLVLLVGSDADNETLAHELGHNLQLVHSNFVPGMEDANLMNTGGLYRDHVTVGQCFQLSTKCGAQRAHQRPVAPVCPGPIVSVLSNCGNCQCDSPDPSCPPLGLFPLRD